MASMMRGGLGEVQGLPDQAAYALDRDTRTGKLGGDSYPFLPPIMTQMAIHPFHPQSHQNLPSLQLSLPNPPTTRSEGVRRTASSPEHTPRYSPYERSMSQPNTSPTQRARFPASNSSPSLDGSYHSPMARRQEARPPPPFQSMNTYSPVQQHPTIKEEYEMRAPPNTAAMAISNLLNQVLTVPATELYSIRVRQQPLHARMCGNGLADRRHIDPPPVVQLFLNDPNMNLSDINKKLVVLHCLLYHETEDREERLTEHNDNKRLEGGASVSPFIGKDDLNEVGAFFIFPDLSVRCIGRYRLKFQLSITDLDPRQNQISPFMAECFSKVFTVSLPTGPDRFPGMSESTPLTKALKNGGCYVKLRRGTAATSRQRRDGDGSSEGENFSTSNKPSKAKSGRKKAERRSRNGSS